MLMLWTALAAPASAQEQDVLDEIQLLTEDVVNYSSWFGQLLGQRLMAGELDLGTAQEEYEVIDLTDYTDPSTASMHLTTGAILLRDPLEIGGQFVRFVYEDGNGGWVRHPDGRYLVTNWYETPDGRLSKYVTYGPEAVGTYTIDPINGGYELNLDLDGDLVVDVQDSLTGDGHEQITLSRLGRMWADAFVEGQNSLCYAPPPEVGRFSFGGGADGRAFTSGCQLSRGGGSGGFFGSLGDPAQESTPIDDLCEQFSSGDGGAALLDSLDLPTQATCEDKCAERHRVCVGQCRETRTGSSLDTCVGVCRLAHTICDAACILVVDAAGTTEEVPEAEPNSPSAPQSRFYDTDNDGHADAEDTDEDGAPDLSCSSTGCGSEAYPPPIENLTGQDWDAFCRDSPSGLDRLTEMEKNAADCPAIDESEFASFSARYADWGCFAPPEDISHSLTDLGSSHCEVEVRGCEPVQASITGRARYLLQNEATVVFYADCGDDLVCQPGY